MIIGQLFVILTFYSLSTLCSWLSLATFAYKGNINSTSLFICNKSKRNRREPASKRSTIMITSLISIIFFLLFPTTLFIHGILYTISQWDSDSSNSVYTMYGNVVDVNFENLTANDLIGIFPPSFYICGKFALYILYYHRLYDVLDATAFKYSSKTYKKIRILIGLIITNAIIGDLLFVLAKSFVWLMIIVFVTFFILDISYCITVTFMFLSKLNQVVEMIKRTTRLASVEQQEYDYPPKHSIEHNDDESSVPGGHGCEQTTKLGLSVNKENTDRVDDTDEDAKNGSTGKKKKKEKKEKKEKKNNNLIQLVEFMKKLGVLVCVMSVSTLFALFANVIAFQLTQNWVFWVMLSTCLDSTVNVVCIVFCFEFCDSYYHCVCRSASVCLVKCVTNCGL